MAGKLKLFVSDSYITPYSFEGFSKILVGFNLDILDITTYLDITSYPEVFCCPKEQIAWTRSLIEELNTSDKTLYILTNSDFIVKEINLQMMAYQRIIAGCELVDKEFIINPDLVQSYTLTVIHDQIQCTPNEKDVCGYIYPTMDAVIGEMNKREEKLLWGYTDDL